MVPARDRGQAPGVDQQQVGRERRQRQDVRIDAPSQQQGRSAEAADGQDAGQMQRIDPRQPRPEELAIAEAAPLHRGKVDVAEDEAGQGEEHLDPEVALGDERRHAVGHQPRPVEEHDHPRRGEEAEAGQGFQVFGLHRILRPAGRNQAVSLACGWTGIQSVDAAPTAMMPRSRPCVTSSWFRTPAPGWARRSGAGSTTPTARR